MKSHSDNKLLVLMESLPVYCMGYFSSILSLNINTRIAYAGDLKLFFEYLCMIHNCNTHDITIDILKNLTTLDIQAFFEYIESYNNNGQKQKNSEYGMKRKLTAIKSFFKYLYSIGKLNNNPADLVDLQKYVSNDEKIHYVLKDSEKVSMVNEILNEENKSIKSQMYHDMIKYRDKSIVMLFLYTGISVSELVGLDMSDVNLEERHIVVISTKKDKKQEKIIPLSDDIFSTLSSYLTEERLELLSYSQNDSFDNNLPGPLFVSLRHRRMSVRQIENIVKKYATNIFSENTKITPNTLRKTYFNSVYDKNKDILNTLGYTGNYGYISDK